MRNKFTPLLISVFILLLSGISICSFAEKKHEKFVAKPFENKVFIEEHGQFTQRATENGITLPEKVKFGVENGEFYAYFSPSGLTFQFAEYKPIERKDGEDEKEKEGEKEADGPKFERVWHSVNLKFLNANPQAEVVAGEKVHEYYNYAGFNNSAQYNFVPAYKTIRYENLYPGVDAEFELPAEGGIKYKFIVQPGVTIPEIAYEFGGTENLALDSAGSLIINSLFGKLTDHAPSAYTSTSHQSIAVKYGLEGNRVKFQFSSSEVSSPEGIVIDPWITATTFPATNSAFEIQEDGAGNVVVMGSTSNYQVQKYSPTGVLIWTYVTASIFLGDIAVDVPGNVYIVGGYSAGKRQKLNSSGVQQWVFPGLSEEWRLAFDYSKTTLTVGGYFIDPGGNNLGRFDTSTGAISNEIVYGDETRGIATDCNGDMYSLHVTFGFAGVAASNMLKKTNANFTPAGSVTSGFLLAEAEPASGYAPNPLYGPNIYQGINALVVRGFYVYAFDGASIRRFDKTSLAFINSVNVPNGARMMCSGIAADYCGNIYAGTLNGIAVYDSTLTYQQTIAAPGVVYDILLSNAGNLLVCGAGFLASVDITCGVPAALSATTNTLCAGTGSLTAVPSGGIGPYTYLWQPNGQTTASINNPPAGNYPYVVSDAFCHTYAGTAVVNASPVAAFTSASTGVSNGGPNTVCAAGTIQFTDGSTVPAGTTLSRSWDFGDGSPVDVSQNPQHVYASPGTYTVKLIVTTNMGCSDSSTVPVQVYPLPFADFTAPSFCPGVQGSFTNQSSISSGTIASYTWNFGDGSATSNLPAPAHSYALSNTYHVGLAVTSANGCVHDTTITVLVNPSPIANFSTTNVCLGAPSVFTDLSSVASPATISSWAWDIGNNGSVDFTTPNPTYTFASAGTVNVLLTVVSSTGCLGDTLLPVTVFAGVTASFSATNVCQKVATVFTDQSTVTSGNIINWEWSFGDTSTSTGQSPLYTYPAAGTYQVQLRITSNEGCSDSIAKPVTVYPLPVVDFGTVPANGCVPLNVVLTDQSTIATGNNVAWNWQAGNLFSSAQQYTGFTFSAAGTYSVTLTVTSDKGCMDSLTKQITAYPLPVAGFTAVPAAGCAPLNVTLNDLSSVSTGSVVTWNWQAGTLYSSAQQNTSFNFTAVGVHNITLTVTSDKGCMDSVSKPITVYPSPVVDFEAVPASGCVPLNVALRDLSSIATGSNVAWNWQVGNLFSSAQQNTGFNFTTDGTYNVTLAVTSDMGCSSTLTRNDFIVVYANPVAEFAPNPQQAELNEPQIQFTDLSTGSPVQWNWQFGTGDGSTLQNPAYTYQHTGTYTVHLEIADQHGCTDTVSHTVDIIPAPTVFIPNAFTPNGDGNNDTWGIIANNVKYIELQVFDRLGEKVFESNNINERWDGTYRSKPLMPGVFVYQCTLVNTQDVTSHLKGSVTLLR